MKLLRATKQSKALMPSPSFVQLVSLPVVSSCFGAIIELEIADHLSDGSKSVNELAELTGLKREVLTRLLRALIPIGCFIVSESGEDYSLGPTGRYLCSGVNGAMPSVVRHTQRHLTVSVSQLSQAIASETPWFEFSQGVSYFDYLNSHSDERDLYLRACEESFLGFGLLDILLDVIDWEHVRTLVDVGPSLGENFNKLANRFPKLSLVPTRLLEASDADGVPTLLSPNLIQQLDLPSAHVLLLARMLCNFDDEHASQLLRRCHEAVKSSGQLVAIEPVFLASAPNPAAMVHEIRTLVLFGGRIRTPDEIKEMAAEAGLSVEIVRIHQPSGCATFIMRSAAAP